jgi:hypothetical protein
MLLSLLLFLKVNASPAAPAITLSACDHGKDRYTVGGIVENPDHSLMKCSVKDGSVYWQQIDAQSKKAFRAPAQKKYIPPADSD